MEKTIIDRLTAQDVFGMAVAQVASQALDKYPDDHKQIEAACRLLAAGAVTLHADGYHKVCSETTAEVIYTVNGTCTCIAFARGMERCKHRWSVTLYKAALALLQEEAWAKQQRRVPPIVSIGQRPCLHRYCQTHDRILVRRTGHAGYLYGHVDRARRFSVCPG